MNRLFKNLEPTSDYLYKCVCIAKIYLMQLECLTVQFRERRVGIQKLRLFEMRAYLMKEKILQNFVSLILFFLLNVKMTYRMFNVKPFLLLF